MRVLIVEDDDDDQLLMALVVGNLFPDADVVLERTLRGGLSRADDGFDLVLLDLNLPDSMGPKDTVRSFAPVMGETHVVIVTGSDDRMLLLDALEAGASGFAFKSQLRWMLETAIPEALIERY